MATVDQLTQNYLGEVHRELRDLPRERRREIVDELAEHIAEARAAGEVETEGDARTLLDRLGAPAEIAAEARERFGIEPVEAGALENWALFMLSIGSLFVPIVGWLFGVLYLWGSPIWSQGEKLLGTLVVPGGIGAPFWIAVVYGEEECPSGFRRERCSGGLSDLADAVLVTAFLMAVVCVIYLPIRRNIRSNAAADRRRQSLA